MCASVSCRMSDRYGASRQARIAVQAAPRTHDLREKSIFKKGETESGASRSPSFHAPRHSRETNLLRQVSPPRAGEVG